MKRAGTHSKAEAVYVLKRGKRFIAKESEPGNGKAPAARELALHLFEFPQCSADTVRVNVQVHELLSKRAQLNAPVLNSTRLSSNEMVLSREEANSSSWFQKMFALSAFDA
eukprot:2235780-Pleurochrysis_carterae.AAC.1